MGFFSTTGNQYITTTAVVIAETMKLIICSCIIWCQQPTTSAYVDFMYNSLIVNWQDTLKLSVPAIVYALQNNLQYVAVSNLEAAVFQVNNTVFRNHIYLKYVCVAMWLLCEVMIHRYGVLLP